jgi:hypothetical protein
MDIQIIIALPGFAALAAVPGEKFKPLKLVTV